jgi:hypothetical protein
MSEFPGTPSQAVACNPATEPRAARRAKFKREQVIVDYLNRGVSVAEIAARFDVGEKRMRAIIREILARRMPAPPEEFVAIQVSRLNEALLVAYSAMSGMNLKAVDRVVRIVRELDRYHGFVAAERRLPEPAPRITVRGLEAPGEGGMAFGAAFVCRAELALRNIDETEFSTGAAARADDQSAVANLVSTPGLDPGVSRDTSASLNGGARWSMLRDAMLCVAPQHEGDRFASAASAVAARPENPPQSLDTIESAPGVAEGSDGAGAAYGERQRDHACARPEPEEDASAAEAPPDDRPTVAPPDIMLAPSTEGASKDVPMSPNAGAGWNLHRDATLGVAPPHEHRGFGSVGGALDDRPGIPPQDIENVGFAPGTPLPADATSVSGPAFPNPIGVRRVNVRMTPNGMYAC